MKSMKVWRAFIANLSVVLLLTASSGGGAVVAAPTSPVAQEVADDTKITAEEEQEAREIAERLMQRMREINDIAPLINELFVPGYAERLRQDVLVNQPPTFLSRSAVEQASRDELVRYQVALNNSLYQATLLFLAYRTSHPVETDDGVADVAYYLHKLPPDIIELCKDDPILKKLFEEDAPDGANEDRPDVPVEKARDESGIVDSDEDGDEEEPIRTVEQLRSFTSTLERANALARKHIAASPLKLNLLDIHKGANEEENRLAEREAMRPRVRLLDREFYGYPKDTSIICVNVLIYHMDLIRIDGKLKVVAFYPDMD